MQPDVLVVGGGLAGSSAAITLARLGHAVILLERDRTAQHKVCGEFLSAEALGYLGNLGIDPQALGGVKITKVRFAGRLGVSEAKLPFAAVSLTRKALDDALLHVAENSGVEVRRGVTVRDLHRTGDRWCAKVGEGREFQANNLFVATGKHDLRDHARPEGAQGDLIGFKMYFRLTEKQRCELEGYVELNLFREGYAGLQMVEEGAANLCCVVRRKRYKRLGGGWDSLLQRMKDECPHLAGRLQGAESLLQRPLAVSPIPYGYVREQAQGMWSLGDQAAVIPSFTGDGMSIALHSGILAAEMLAEGATPEQYQRRLHDEVSGQVRLATLLSRGLVAEPQKLVMQAVVRAFPSVMRLVARRTRLQEGRISVALDAASVGSY